MNRIPKILHLYWDGSPMSWLQTLTIETFIKYNPDWRISIYLPNKVYTGELNYIPPYIGTDFFWLVKNNPGVTLISVDLNDYDIKEDLHDILRSDIFRYHLLYDIGGVWSDFDVIWLRPMSHLSKIAGRNDFTTTICLLEDNNLLKWYNISILVSEPGHPFYKSIIDECNSKQAILQSNPEHQEYGTTLLNMMFPDVKELLEEYPGMVKLDYPTFFPYSIFEMEKLYFETDLALITDDVMCVHWFNGHKLSKEYVNKNRFGKCSMTEIVKHSLGADDEFCF